MTETASAHASETCSGGPRVEENSGAPLFLPSQPDLTISTLYLHTYLHTY